MALLASISLVIAGASGAEPYAVGDRIEPFDLRDQHDLEHRVDESTEIVLLSRNMAAGKVIKQALEAAGSEALRDRHAVYVADISGMPGLVARLFAIPSMRKRSYPMLLDRDGEASARLPDGGDRATLIRCNGLEITHIGHFEDPAELRSELGIAAE
jgi:hypothetical protein